MTDHVTAQDVPPVVMGVLRIFLAYSSRGEEAVLVLETRKEVISTKFRSVESTVGVPPAPTNISLATKKKKEFRKKKSSLAAGSSTNSNATKRTRTSWTRRRMGRTDPWGWILPAPHLK
jgi:hypothetical protein